MAKPSKLSTQLGKQYDIIKSSVINTLFNKLEEIRVYHANASPAGFSQAPAAFNTTFTQQDNIIYSDYPAKIKEYITALEQSRYITDGAYSSRVPVPDQYDLITVANYLIEDIDIINDLTTLDANCTANYTADYKSNNSPVYSGDNAAGGSTCGHACGSNWCSGDCVN